jgi:hypothetical protein
MALKVETKNTQTKYCRAILMKENTFFEVTFFDPDHTLIAMLERVEIEFRKVLVEGNVEGKFVVALTFLNLVT